jgi:hypothetical protein
MARIRSPNYPAISLADAINRVGQVHAKERQHPAAKEVVLKGMGYSGVHGTSLGALSAALKYGLLEQGGKGEDYRVTDRAMAILHPHTPEEKARAIDEAARAPALFSELLEHFKGELPSDDNLRAYLVRRGFSQTSLPSVIQAFRDTIELVSSDTNGYTPLTEEPPKTMTHQGSTTIASRSNVTVRPISVMFNGDRLEVSAVLDDAESVDRLIKALEANKTLLPGKSPKIETAS